MVISNNNLIKNENTLKSSVCMNLNLLSNEFHQIEINSLTLNRTGQIEIGQSVEIEINYTLNCSDYFIVTQNWVDLSADPLNRTNLIYPVTNYKYNESFDIDPDRFDPDDIMNYTAIANIETLAMNGSLFGTSAISQEKIKILKANLECSIISDIPELIFSNEKLKFICKFFNEHNNKFVLKDKLININLYDFQFHLIQNVSKFTDSNGNLEILLDFDLGVPGTHHLYLNAENLVDYKDFTFYKTFDILDINSSFCVSVENESNLPVSTNFDNRLTQFNLESKFEGIFKWNSSFAGKYFEENVSSLHFYSNFTNPQIFGTYRFDIQGNLTNYNKTVIFPVYLSFNKRNLNKIQSTIRLNNHEEIEINQRYVDSLTGISEIYDFLIDFYLNIQNNWTKICSLSNHMGLISSKININDYLEFLNETIEIKLILNSSSYYSEELRHNYSIPKIYVGYSAYVKSSTNNEVNLQLFNKNGNFFSNQSLKIYINNGFYIEIITDDNGSCSFYAFASNYARLVSIQIIFDENPSYIPYIHYMDIIIIPNELNLIISNFGIFSSIFLILPFCFLIVKTQKNKNKMIDMKI